MTETLRSVIELSVQDAVLRAIASSAHRRYIGQETESLQDELSRLLGGSSVMLTNSGTSALELALKSIGVTAGDEVILSAYDYPGNFWVIEELGCVPVLVDVVENSTCVEIQSLESAKTDRTRACIVSHLHGQLQLASDIRAWSDINGILMIEDACQAIGAKFHDQPIGTNGHIATFSFGGSKVLSAGRGGALATQDERLFQRAKIASGAGSGAFALSEVSAAIVAAQLRFLDEINRQCCDYFNEVDRELAGMSPSIFLGADSGDSNAYYQAGWIVESQRFQVCLAKRLNDLGIACGAGFPGFHRRSARRCRATGFLSNTANLVDRLLVIHYSVALDSRFTAKQVAEAIQESSEG